MDKVVQIDDFRITQVPCNRLNACEHRHFTLNPDGDIVTCDDCQQQISAFSALQTLVSFWDRATAQLRAREQRLAEAEQASLHLRAARAVEQTWRGRKFAVACPHCRRGILPEDGLKHGRVSRELEVARRKTQPEQRR